jgi:hypothetical protein
VNTDERAREVAWLRSRRRRILSRLIGWRWTLGEKYWAAVEALRTILSAALAEHTRRNPPPLRDDTAGYGIGDPKRGRW